MSDTPSIVVSKLEFVPSRLGGGPALSVDHIYARLRFAAVFVAPLFV